MAEAKTKPTKISVREFLDKAPNQSRRNDAQTLLKLFERVTGWKPQMWGPTIIGFGAYDYVYESGTKGSICVVGFSPRASSLVVYSGVMAGDPKNAKLLAKLGKHKTGRGCLYINNLADIDLGEFEKLIEAGLANQKKKVAENGWTIRPA